MIAALDVDITDDFHILIDRVVQLASDPAPLALDEEWPDVGTVIEPIPWEDNDNYLLGAGYLLVRWGIGREVWTHRYDLVVWAEEHGPVKPPDVETTLRLVHAKTQHPAGVGVCRECHQGYPCRTIEILNAGGAR